jgi:hypothetical protein
LPEIFLCPECRKRVDLQDEEYVIPNRATAKSKAQWIYAHVACSELRIGDMSDSELERRFQEMLETHLAGLSDERLSELGLQRRPRPTAESDARNRP